MRRPDYHRDEVVAVALLLLLVLLLAAARVATRPPAPARLEARPTRLDVNHADRASLAALPGVGPVAANAILLGRPYARLEELRAVLGERRYAAVRELLVLTAPSSSRADPARTRGSDPAPGSPPRAAW